MQSLMHLQRGLDFFLLLDIYTKMSSIIQREYMANIVLFLLFIL